MPVIERVEIERPVPLAAYRERLRLRAAVSDLEQEARLLADRLSGRKVWLLSSTAMGGGVAEMLRPIMALLAELRVPAEWLVIRPPRPDFFALTKRLHNLIHGEGDAHLTSDDRALYDEVSAECAEELRPMIAPRDVLIPHDPQPLGTGARIKRAIGLTSVWRCHIGLDYETPQTVAAWRFLQEDALAYDHTVFSAPEYIPAFLAGRASVIPPGIDPLSPKNCDLRPQEIVETLCRAGLLPQHAPIEKPPFAQPARRLRDNGLFGPADDIGLLFRPVLLQISRWDRLKGWLPLLDGFCRLKRAARDPRTSLLRLVMAGPDPAGVADDPEARDVLAEVCRAWQVLPPELREDVAVVVLPLHSRLENALMVNALQRSATIVAQNSLREGFGLTVAEAMWKSAPILGTHACGIRNQVRDGIDGILVRDPENPDEIASALARLLASDLGALGRAAERRVFEQFLVFEQLARWMRLVDDRVKLLG